MDVDPKKKGKFSRESAFSYDQQRQKLAPIKEALHLCMKMVLSHLPENARILCVGAGTGSELVFLGKAFPKWHFTVVEPETDMLSICEETTKKEGIYDRCFFHEGYLDSLAKVPAHDAATSILVSHFIINLEEREKFFSEISNQLKSNGILINADLSSDMSSNEHKRMRPVWKTAHQYAGMPDNIESFGKDVSLLPKDALEDLLKISGFNTPVLFYQCLYIHAWFSKLEV